MTTAKKLYRSRNDRVLGGVCGGLAAYFGSDPILWRAVAVASLLAGSLGFWTYLILWLVVPEEPVSA